MAKLVNNNKDNPKLGQRELEDGRISLYLEYYLGRESIPVLDENGQPVLYETGKMAGTPKYKVKHTRRKENLNIYLESTPRTPQERSENKNKLLLAKKIRQEREQELLENKEGYRLKKDKAINFLDYFQNYIDNYTKRDYRGMCVALNRFKNFLEESPEYKMFKDSIKPNQLNRDMMLSFTEYLQKRSVGEGAKNIWQKFKKVVKHAVEHDVIRKSPCDGIVIKIDRHILKKEVLSLAEIQTLMSTHYEGENPIIRRAFILCLYCGLRFCDVKDLTFSNVDYSNKLLRFEQNKTKGHSANSGVVTPLNDDLLKLIGYPSTGQDKNSFIFPLPSHTMCLKALRRWTARAGIEKHITWHCARHSFATNILINGANIKTVQSLMGHASLEETEKYTRAIDSLKQDAINSLPMLDSTNF